MATSLPVELPANLKSIQPYLEMATDYQSMDPSISYWCRLYALKQGFILKRVEEDLSFLLDLMEVLSNNKKELQSKLEVTDIPVARAHVEGVVQKLLNWAENAPPLVSFTNVVTKAFHSAGMLLDVCNIFGEPSEDHQAEKTKYSDTHGANLDGEFDSKTSKSTAREINIPHSNVGGLSENLAGIISEELGNAENKKTGSLSLSIRTTTSNGENRKSLNVAKENGRPKQGVRSNIDERKKIYDRLFLLELLNHPASQKRPDGLPSLEIVKNKMGRNKIVADGLLGVQHQPRPNGATSDFGERLSQISGLPDPISPIINTKPQAIVVPPPTVAQLRETSWRARSYSKE